MGIEGFSILESLTQTRDKNQHVGFAASIFTIIFLTCHCANPSTLWKYDTKWLDWITVLKE